MLMASYAGTEELDEVVQEEIQETVEEVVKAEIAEVNAEIAEVAEEVEDLAEAIEENEEAVEELEEVVEGMESLLNSGNYNATVFTHLYNRGAKLSAKLGGKAPNRMGAESFSDAATAEMMAREGIESFGDTAKGWVDSAIKFIKELFNRAIAFVTGLFDKTKGLEKRIAQVESKIGGTIKAKVPAGSWNVSLDIEGEKNISETKANSAAPSMIQAIFTNNDAIFNNSFAKKVDDAAKSGWFGKNQDKGQNAILKDFKSGYARITGALGFGKKVNGAADKDQGIMDTIGGYRVVYTVRRDSIDNLKDATSALKALKVKMTKDSAKAKSLTDGSLKPLSESQLKGCIKAAKASIESVRKSKTDELFSKARRDTVVASLKAAGAEDGGKEAIAFVRQFCVTSSSFAASQSRITLKVAEDQVACVAAHY